MPYNTSAIPPSEEATGTTQLPVSRIKKTINLDQDINASSTSATFLITLATEMFIQYLAEQGHNIVMSEKKPRKGLAYKDLASAVSRQDNLEFLSDIIPKTVPFSVIKAKKPKESATKIDVATTNGNGEGSSNGNGNSHPHGHNVQQSLINGVSGFEVRNVNGGAEGVEMVDENDDERDAGEDDEGPEAQLERENKGRRVSKGDESADQTDEDVEMK